MAHEINSLSEFQEAVFTMSDKPYLFRHKNDAFILNMDIMQVSDGTVWRILSSTFTPFEWFQTDCFKGEEAITCLHDFIIKHTTVTENRILASKIFQKYWRNKRSHLIQRYTILNKDVADLIAIHL